MKFIEIILVNVILLEWSYKNENKSDIRANTFSN